MPISIIDILLLSIALAMDCFTVSIMCGVIVRRRMGLSIIRMTVLFGLFQALMPLIGWLGTAHFSQYLEAIDHWIAFALLLFIGGKMIKDYYDDEDHNPTINPLKFLMQLILAIATSIDALAVGISFACLGFTDIKMLTLPLVMIGATSAILSTLGYWLGVRLGKVVAQRLKPELWGGLVLIFIGVKILISHLFDN